MTKSLYRITDKNGSTLCFQVASNKDDAIDFAKMYGHRSARKAEFVREE